MNKKILLSGILSLVLCITMIAGGTFALFTSESTNNVAINSGTVNVVATIKDLELYSPTLIADDATNSITDATNAATATNFANGGTAELNGSTLTLTNMTPGDKVTFNVHIENNSNVTVKIRTVFSTVDEGLLNALVIKVDEHTYNGAYNTPWATKVVGDPIADQAVSIELPTTADDTYQDKKVALSVVVEAVQGNTDTTDTPAAVPAGTAEDLKTLITDALQSGGAIDLTNDIEIDGTWESIPLGAYNGVNDITINGNGHKITGLNKPLLSGSFAGSGIITVENLTIDGANIVEDASKANGYSNSGVGAILAYSDASGGVVLKDCRLTNSHIENTTVDGYAGGFIGYSSSAVITATGCSVTGTTIKASSSVGGIVGHAQSEVTATDCIFEGNTLASNDDGDWRVGTVAGTMNLDGSINVFTNCTSTNNTLTQPGKNAADAASELYGRVVGTAQVQIV